MIYQQIPFTRPKNSRLVARKRQAEEKKAARDKVAVYYKKSKWWGIIHDPGFGLPDRPLLQVIVILLGLVAFYGAFALLALLFR
jgi:hypothetical protein